MCGHGVGLRLHEPPACAEQNGWMGLYCSRPGMTIAIEPMIGIGTTKSRIKNDGWTLVMDNGKSSSHFEHTIFNNRWRSGDFNKRRTKWHLLNGSEERY